MDTEFVSDAEFAEMERLLTLPATSTQTAVTASRPLPIPASSSSNNPGHFGAQARARAAGQKTSSAPVQVPVSNFYKSYAGPGSGKETAAAPLMAPPRGPAVAGGGAPAAWNGRKTAVTCQRVGADRFGLAFPYDAAVIAICKQQRGRVYDASTKMWTFPLADYPTILESLMTSPDLHVVISELPPEQSTEVAPMPPIDWTKLPPSLARSLLPFQRNGVEYAVHHGGRVLIGDEMGLGKTIQAIAVACYYRAEWPVLVVAPSSLRAAWAEAFVQWVDDVSDWDVCVIWKGKDEMRRTPVVVISYDLVKAFHEQIKERNFKVIILDESHFIKSPTAQRTKLLLPFVRAAKRAVLLSGTPALSRPKELFTQLNLVNRSCFPNFKEFAVRYCGGTPNQWGDYTGASNLDELQRRMREHVMIRRLKADVLDQLPPKRRQTIYVDAAPDLKRQTKEMMRQLGRLDAQLAQARPDAALEIRATRNALLTKLYSLTGVAKVPSISSYVEDLLEADVKFLIFAHHKEVLDQLSAMLDKKNIGFIRIDGATSAQRRQEHVNLFQQDKHCRVAVLSVTAAGMGLTLTAASTVLFAELHWTPGVLIQAEDRAHRIGQKSSVNVQYLLAKDTLDDSLWPLIQRKLSVLNDAGLSKDQMARDGEDVAPDQTRISDFYASVMNNDQDVTPPAEPELAGAAAPPAPSALESDEHRGQKRAREDDDEGDAWGDLAKRVAPALPKKPTPAVT